jgi:hypothetical protein
MVSLILIVPPPLQILNMYSPEIFHEREMSSGIEGSGTKKRSMRLLVDTKAQRVLYAQAGKDVADFLFSVRAMPAWSRSSIARSVRDGGNNLDNLDLDFIWRSINRGIREGLITEIDGGAVPYCSACQRRRSMSMSTTTVPCAAGALCVQQAGDATYTIMDDLQVAPMSAISGLNIFKVNIGTLEEMTVQVGHNEVGNHSTSQHKSVCFDHCYLWINL